MPGQHPGIAVVEGERPWPLAAAACLAIQSNEFVRRGHVCRRRVQAPLGAAPQRGSQLPALCQV